MATNFISYSNLIIEAVRRVRQVPGAATQLYSEQVLGSYIQEAYTILRQEAWWPWLMKRLQGTLDGTTGVDSLNPWSVGGLTDFTDIRAVWLGPYQQRLPMLGEDINPATVVGNQFARYVEPLSLHDDPTGLKLFKIIPVTTVGQVYVWARVDPTSLFTDPAVLIPMNKFLLLNYTAFRYFSDDAANPAAATSALQAYEKIKEQELSKINEQPFWLDPGTGQATDQWWEYP